MIDLNAARKRKRGLTDDGCCSCGRYRLFCRNGCLDEQTSWPNTVEVPGVTLAADVLRRMAAERALRSQLRST